MPISERHRIGLRDFFFSDSSNKQILLQLTKSVSKNCIKADQPEEAFDAFISLVEDVYIVLYKRNITKELLFKYLFARQRGNISTDFSKSDLILRVLQYWDSPDLNAVSEKSTDYHVSTEKDIEQYPIHQMARKFSEWFFDKYNQNNLQLEDFWTDVTLQMKIIADDGFKEEECVSNEEVLSTIIRAKNEFGFYFNPNLTYEGTQGRMSTHGLVIALSCGTLHTTDRCVGIFECSFGLLRDPFADNNWKLKHLNCVLQSKCTNHHALASSNSLKEALMLPAPSDELG